MTDIPSNARDIEGSECGKMVLVDHLRGWQTTLRHLKRSSVDVRAGDMVATDDLLGQIGASGSTHFSHVH